MGERDSGESDDISDDEVNQSLFSYLCVCII